jgi:transcription initiation factor IIF auxiliary subunit
MQDSILIIGIVLVITALAVIALGVGTLINGWLRNFDDDMDEHEHQLNELHQRQDVTDNRLRSLETSSEIMRFEMIREKMEQWYKDHDS